MSLIKENCIVFCYTRPDSNKVEFNKIVCKDNKFKINYLNQELEFEYNKTFNCYTVSTQEQCYHLIHEFPLSVDFKDVARLDLTFVRDSFLTKERSFLSYVLFMFITMMLLLTLVSRMSFTESQKSSKAIKKEEKELDEKRIVDLLKKMEEKKPVKVAEVKPPPKPKPEPKPKPPQKLEPQPVKKIAKASPPKKAAPKTPKKTQKVAKQSAKRKIFKVNQPQNKLKTIASSKTQGPPPKLPGRPVAPSKIHSLGQRFKKLGALSSGALAAAGSATKSYGSMATKSFNNNGPKVGSYGGGNNLANKYADSVVPSGEITTTGSRGVAGNASTAAGRIGGGNSDIQGKVATTDLYDNSYGESGGSGFVGGSAGGTGSFQASSGLDSKGILKMLKKYQAKFTYCYEKALIGQPNLQGDALVVWQITGSGAAKSINVKKSTLNSSQVHKCITGVLSSINFSGLGQGKVEYPFKFSASKM